MLAAPDSTIETMVLAYSTTINALTAAQSIDGDLDAATKKFLAGLVKKLQPTFTKLVTGKRALEDYDWAKGALLQAAVELGDVVLDRGVSDARKRTDLALKNKPGPGVEHVFGPTLATLTKEKLALEPMKVKEAVARLDDIGAFAEKKLIAKDLSARAGAQQAALDAREAGAAARNKLVSANVALVNTASLDLARVKAQLDEQFPRQRDYVAAFFYDVKPRPAAAAPTPTTPPAS